MDALLFQLGKKLYAIDIGDIDEILMMSSIRPIPSAPNFLAGVLNLRGELIPVTDLRTRIGHYEVGSYTKDTRIIIITVEGRRLGLIIQGLENIQKIMPKEKHSNVIEENAIPSYVDGIALESGEMIQIINIKKILNEAEIAAIRIAD